MLGRSLSLVALLVIGACGSDEEPRFPTVDSFCEAKAAAECKVAAGPCAIAEASCRATRRTTCLGEGSAATAQGRTYTSSLAEDCIGKTTAVYADRVPDAAKEAAYVAACAHVFAGNKELSAACTTEYECKTGLVCDVEKGFCGTPATKRNNDPCNNPGEICDVGLYCQQRGSSRFCSPKGKVGDVCSATFPCSEDLTCNGKVCVDKLASGEPCETGAECVTTLCNSAKRCAARQFPTATGTCEDFGGSP